MTSSPVVRDVRVVPVAGHDSLLLNLSGGHYPVFTRNLVIMEDETGRTGLGETPGGESIRRVLEAAGEMAAGQPVGSMAGALESVRNRFAHLDSGGRGEQTFDSRVMIHALAALESAFLDLLGQHLDQPVANLLGGGRRRSEVDVLGYLFFVGNTERTGLAYRGTPDPANEWERLRHREALDSGALVELAGACIDAFGFRQLKLKGGVLASRAECECMLALHEAFPGVGLTIDPNAAWTLDEAMRALKPLREKLAYAEDPCGAEPGLTAVQAMAEFRRSTSIPVASNMIATDLAGLLDAVREDAIDIPLADCHFWTLRGAAMVAQLCHAWGLTWGSHSNNHFDVSLAMMTHVAAAAPGNPAPIDTHWIWQTGQRLTREPLAIRDGRIRVPEGPGLGVEIDMAQVEEAHRLYRSLGLAGRDDAIVMRDLVPGWRFDPKRPCLVR